ncbi:ATP-dependent DNA helicase RecG [Lusitaniella coriacea LEGE 07157]|uniref:ATP-dependent DNA helicase RecG n=1 Tax=Lusitaniella coriacea LEGE 07157 TaxID=945747 RepID=A0A8J7DVI6_9CYAN|nr:ATP-dependent DNA helicase RecG [Lusitaniella coriacea]MBE9115814.1 ATP-dependent DNA helicase RecG [Lusitaniella coriacea LEGE 07157]
MTDSPNWERLQKALSVEADRGFGDLMGKQYRFSEFMVLSFGESLNMGTIAQRGCWQALAEEFLQYSHLSPEQRKTLLDKARSLLNELQGGTKAPVARELLKTKPIAAQVSQSYGTIPQLKQSLATLPEIRRRRSAKALERLGLHTVQDVLTYYPRDYLDYARQVSISQLVPGETVTLVGTVKRCNCFTSPKNKKLSIFELIIRDRAGQIKLNRFYAGAHFANRGWQEKLKRQYPVGSIVAAAGLVKKNKYGITLDNPEIEVLDSSGSSIESINIGRVLPVYPLTEGVTADVVRQAVVAALPAVQRIQDPLPPALRDSYSLIELPDAIAHVHFPPDPDTLTHARRRLIFDEFFYLQLGFLQRRAQQKALEKSAVLSPTGQLSERFQELLPFKLTNAQQRVVGDILEDLNSETPMNRLVQGDVGSGKTVVAVFAILAAIQSGYQAALMTPTEVLAEQHYHKLVSWFNLLHLPVELLTGSTKTVKRREIHSQLETGELPLLVGTHALIQDKVNFRKLGLVVIDEQHRFGVEQRARLLDKGKSPHVLTMTATPIPRTLTLTLHGDLDVSQIDELPPGRQPIQTTCVTGRQRTKTYDLIRREVVQGRQAYIILSTIEESEKLNLRAAVEEHKRLQEEIFPEFQIGLLHGRMSSADKEKALTQFRNNETQIIVSTTVIEVGVDVPNATVMLIENAERFGLSQLHQLRGRVGRGSHKSHCLLMSGTNNPDAKQRLSVLEQSQDGFFISEMDLRFRGPGEVLGRRQSGLADFALASLVEDRDVLNLAREAAEKLIMADNSLQDFPTLQQELERRYQKLIGGAILT